MAEIKEKTEEKDASTEDMPLLSVQNLHVWFELRKFGFGHAGYVRAVDDVSFDLEAGNAIAVVGESGCGKTSLMMQDYRSKIGFVQQDPYGALPPFMSIQRILEEPLIINGVKDPKERMKRIRQVMEEVRMIPVEDFIEKFPHMLSGGQQQRVVIARAMILEPKLIVADEPVSMLDASVRVEILKLLEKLQESHNLAVIYITHDLSTVRYFSERIFVMYAGKIAEKAYVEDILNSPKHPYTEALLTATSEPDAANARIYKEVPPGEPPSLVNPPAGCRYHPRCPKVIEGLCDVEVPPEFEPTPNHYTICWLHKED